MTYSDAIEFLYGLRLFGLKLGLENTRRLAELCGNPQQHLRFIHIAGTNGKGSVAAMLESIYRESGLRVGLYTSPHLVSFRERIQVNREPIPEGEVARLAGHLRDLSGLGLQPSRCAAAEASQDTSGPGPKGAGSETGVCATFFEFVTVMALRHFVDEHCDLVIWETGLGGRLDATNIVHPLASVITNVEPDHQRWLGHDLESIATEKAGIIKPGVPVVTAASRAPALSVIQDTANALASPLTRVTAENASAPPLNTIQLPLPGWHQRLNAATALAAVRVLQAEVPVGDAAIRSGLEQVRWTGRLQVLTTADNRRLLLDGAHNVAAARSLRTVLEDHFADSSITLILGILQDKDWTGMCRVLASAVDRIICVPVKSDRGTPPATLVEACRSANAQVEASVAGSLAEALARTANNPIRVVAGSLYLVGEALQLLNPVEHSAGEMHELNEWSPRQGGWALPVGSP